MASVLEHAPLIRPMREADVGAVIAIERRGYPFPWTEGIFRDCLRVGYPSWVYTIDEVVRGYAVMSCAAGEAHVLNVCVAPEWQSRGVGERLMQHMIRQSARLGAEQLLLEVRPSNPAAIRLYQRLGFRQVGRRKDYYPDAGGREDALVMARLL